MVFDDFVDQLFYIVLHLDFFFRRELFKFGFDLISVDAERHGGALVSVDGVDLAVGVGGDLVDLQVVVLDIAGGVGFFLILELRGVIIYEGLHFLTLILKTLVLLCSILVKLFFVFLLSVFYLIHWRVNTH